LSSFGPTRIPEEPQLATSLNLFVASEVSDYLTVLARLAVVAILFLMALGFARVLIELRIEQRRKKRLASTRDICALTPSEFEQYVAILFEKAGYHVRQTGGAGDRGVDLEVQRGRRLGVVQCKRYEEAIGPSTIRELIGTMTNVGIGEGYLVTTSDFTPGARREAQKAPYTINLVDGERLVRWASMYGLPGEVMGRGWTGQRT
jgi:HJR/Mrr/RecB family endonuclease